MASLRLSVTVALASIVLGAAPTRAAVQNVPPHLPDVRSQQCPHTLQPPLGALDQIRRALPRLISRDFGDRVNPNGTSFRGWQIVGAISLAPIYPTNVVPGATQIRKAAAARCGAHVAANSWLLVVVFPNMHLINATWRLFVSLTPSGWTLWAYG